MHSVVVHGHFYQPPRENPWRDAVDVEPGAAPFHDWNVRITHECYGPVSAARLLDAAGHVAGRVNLFEWMSFDIGPTLMRWLERHAVDVTQAIVSADRASARRLDGHGNALAMPYHHVILPLASRRDKVREVRWGLADFRARYHREPEGLWLPEAAVDEETLVVLAEQGVRFTVLSPHQVRNPPDDGRPLRFDAGGGRQVALFVYDADLASGVAFGALLHDGDLLARRLMPLVEEIPEARVPSSLTSLATDGETFGHHRKFGEMALARAIALLRAHRSVAVENYAAVLARMEPRHDVDLVSPSSWSCPHGVERWRSDCGCGATGRTSQAWRGPLRSALEWLAGELDARLGAEASSLFRDAEQAVDAFGGVAAGLERTHAAFVAGHLRAGADAHRAARVLDGVAARLAMFSSCAWFFDDVAGHETALMLRLAAYALDCAQAPMLEPELLDRLSRAHSNYPAAGTAADVYHRVASHPQLA